MGENDHATLGEMNEPSAESRSPSERFRAEVEHRCGCDVHRRDRVDTIGRITLTRLAVSARIALLQQPEQQ